VLDRVLERLTRILIENAGAQKGFLLLQRSGGLRLEASVTVEPDQVQLDLAEDLAATSKLAASVVQYVARSHEPVVLADAGSEPRFANDPYVATARPKSLLCVAMLHQARLTGVLYLENNAATGAFSPARAELLQFLAAQAAVAVENAKLYGEVRATSEELRVLNESLEQRVRERTKELARANREVTDALAALREKDRLLQADLDEARGFQQSILPELPRTAGVEFGAVYYPLALVGGDIYDVSEMAPQHYRVFVADATGHGVQASLRTMVLKSEYDRLKASHLAPESLMSELNRRLAVSYPKLAMLCTGCCFDLKLGAGAATLRYVSAAHPPLLHVSRTGIVEIFSEGPCLGASEQVTFAGVETTLEPGDLILACTDGIIEQRGPEGHVFDLQRAVGAATEIAGSLPEALEAVFTTWNEFRGAMPMRDDVTLVAVRVTRN
jgi:serine phosphatase RsbU (regulator of sigma subunit)